MSGITTEQKDKLYRDQKPLRDALEGDRVDTIPLIKESAWVVPDTDRKPENDGSKFGNAKFAS